MQGYLELSIKNDAFNIALDKMIKEIRLKGLLPTLLNFM